MILVQDIIDRTREYLRQELVVSTDSPETLATRVDARPGRSLRAQAFSDEDLILRINRAQHFVMAQSDACLFPDAINDLVLPLAGSDNEVVIPADIHRVMENRIFRNGIRCLVAGHDNTVPRDSNITRRATDAKPVATIGGSYIRIYPDAVNNSVGVVEVAPRLVAVGDLTVLTRLFEEAIIQHVLEGIRTTQSQEGTDGDLFKGLAEMHKKLLDEELAPYSIGGRISKMFVDAESSVELRSR